MLVVVRVWLGMRGLRMKLKETKRENGTRGFYYSNERNARELNTHPAFSQLIFSWSPVTLYLLFSIQKRGDSVLFGVVITVWGQSRPEELNHTIIKLMPADRDKGVKHVNQESTIKNGLPLNESVRKVDHCCRQEKRIIYSVETGVSNESRLYPI